MTVTMATVSFEDSVAVRSGRCRRGRDDHHLDLWLPFPPSDLSHVSLCLTVPSCPASVRFSSHPTLPERSLQSCFSSLFYFIFATCMTYALFPGGTTFRHLVFFLYTRHVPLQVYFFLFTLVLYT